jgi:DNA-binding beta-propeller fold protein YncE
MRRSLFEAALCLTFCCAAAAQGVMTTAVGTDWVFPGDGLPALNAPFGILPGITLDPAGNPVVVDSSDCLVAKILPDATLSVIAGNGICGLTFLLSGDGGPATAAGIFSPFSATYDPQGNLYVPSLFQVRKIAPDGTITLFAGSPTVNWGFSGDGGPATKALIFSGGGLASDTAGNIFLADGGNHRIRKIARDGTISTFAGNGTESSSGDGGPALAAGLSSPSGLAFDSPGNLYVADGGHIRKIALDGTISMMANVSASSLAFDSAGTLYMGSGSIILQIGSWRVRARRSCRKRPE